MKSTRVYVADDGEEFCLKLQDGEENWCAGCAE